MIREHLFRWASDSSSETTWKTNFPLFFAPCFIPTKTAGSWKSLNISQVSQGHIQRRLRGICGASRKVDLSCCDTSNTLISCFGPWILFTSNNYFPSLFWWAFLLNSQATGGIQEGVTEAGSEGAMENIIIVSLKPCEIFFATTNARIIFLCRAAASVYFYDSLMGWLTLVCWLLWFMKWWRNPFSLLILVTFFNVI